MGLLDQLWDETLAGPRPETGLSKLRKFSSWPTSGKERCSARQMDSGNGAEEVGGVTRSIMIVRPGAHNSSATIASSPPLSPLSSFFGGVRSVDINKVRRKSMSDLYHSPSGRSAAVVDAPLSENIEEPVTVEEVPSCYLWLKHVLET